MTDGLIFNNILLGGRTGTNPGQFKVNSGGLAWNRQGGGKTIRIDKTDITSVKWMKVPRAYQLEVRTKDGLFYKFIGFREQDVSNLTSFIQKNMGISPDEKQLSVSGHNWGRVDLDGNMLTFMVGSKQAFEVFLADVSQTQMQGKTDVLLEFHVDDTTGANEGLVHEVFVKALRGLSGSKVTRPGSFRSAQGGYAVKSSLKAEDGLLYPLEKGFFFLPKPPTLILHEEIEFVEFERHGTGGASMSSHYFDLLIKLINDQEHLFRNIQRSEYHNLFNFINAKNLKIMNLGDGQGTGGGVADILLDTEHAAGDPYLARIKNQAGDEESDEEDEDFVVDKDDGGSPTDDSGGEESDASESGGQKEKSSKKEASSSKPPAKRKPKGRDGEGSEKRKPKKKKDPHAPKRPMTPFMYFSKAERAGVKKSNPDLPPTEIAKKLGEMWQKMSTEEKQLYIQQSQVDKKRYEKESAHYRAAAPVVPVDVDSGPANGSD
uniref:Uncharacterized protein n=1 Tax=Avena sativa TaxID=4498 RepID=A0ACD5VYQ8_AVESA